MFFVADGFTAKSKKPGAKREGAFVALSDDDGATWTRRELPADIKTVGYVTATQGPNGVIHIVTSKNHPNYEIELNETWLLEGGAETLRAARKNREQQGQKLESGLRSDLTRKGSRFGSRRRAVNGVARIAWKEPSGD